MKAALYGFRKIFVFVVAVAAVVYLTTLALGELKVITDAKATQLAGIAAAGVTAITTVFATLMSAFKGGYDRDAQIGAAQAKAALPTAPPVP